MNETGQSINVLHYLNPFFAGIGGEESNNRGPQVEAGSRGPGRLLDQLLETRGKVVATLICGDNFFTGHESEITAALAGAVKAYSVDLIIAGPAFSAGRYGLACGSLCQFANEHLGLPAVTAMSMENPGTEFRRRKVYILPAGESVRSMGEVMPRLMRFGVKLAQRQAPGPADVEGYLPRGIRYNERVGKTAAERAVDMVLLKVRGEPFQTEIRLEAQETVTPPAPLGPLDQAVVAIVTEMGFLPHGNPDRIASSRAKQWGRYSIAGMNRVSSDQFMYIHGGYNTHDVDQDPNRGVPVDALRDMEREGRIKQLVDEVFSTCGNGGALTEMKRIGQEMAREVKRRGATAVIIPATWGTGTRSGATLAKEIERAGMPAVVVTCLQDVAVQVGANHILRPHRSTFHSPFGVPDFDPDRERAWRRGAVEAALQSLQKPVDGPQVFEYWGFPFIKAGKVRPLAVDEPSRSSNLPHVPTFKEEGYAEISGSWSALFAPKDTPREIVMKLNAEVGKALENSEMRSFYLERFLVPLAGMPETLAEWLRNDVARWRKVVQNVGIVPQ